MPHKLSPPAVLDVQRIYEEGVECYGIPHADRYADRLDQAFRLLALHPRMARPRAELGGSARAFNCRAHVIFYEVEPDDTVLILRIRHGREDWVNDPV